MAETNKKSPEAKIKKQNILDTITPDDAFAVLNILAKEDTKIKENIERSLPIRKGIQNRV